MENITSQTAAKSAIKNARQSELVATLNNHRQQFANFNASYEASPKTFALRDAGQFEVEILRLNRLLPTITEPGAVAEANRLIGDFAQLREKYIPKTENYDKFYRGD